MSTRSLGISLNFNCLNPYTAYDAYLTVEKCIVRQKLNLKFKFKYIRSERVDIGVHEFERVDSIIWNSMVIRFQFTARRPGAFDPTSHIYGTPGCCDPSHGQGLQPATHVSNTIPH